MATQTNRIILAGGTGFLGGLLADWFTQAGWEVVILSRGRAQPGPGRCVVWDGRTMGDWARELEGARAVVNLAGLSVNCRYTSRNRRLIWDSRMDSTRILGEAIAACKSAPAVWLNSSTATIYKHSFDRPMDEVTGEIGATAAAKDAFSIDVAQAWERTFFAAPTPRTRKVLLRTAMVLATRPGTVYMILRRLARLRLGGSMAGGAQYVSWIHATDFCRAIEWLIEHDGIDGTVNVAAPAPLTNRELMRILRAACHVRVGLPATGWMLELGSFFLRTETELIIKSRRVVPARLQAAGFRFLFRDFGAAVVALESQLTHAAVQSVATHAANESLPSGCMVATR